LRVAGIRIGTPWAGLGQTRYFSASANMRSLRSLDSSIDLATVAPGYERQDGHLLMVGARKFAGITSSDSRPATVVTTAMTEASRDRSMKIAENMSQPLLCGKITGVAVTGVPGRRVSIPCTTTCSPPSRPSSTIAFGPDSPPSLTRLTSALPPTTRLRTHYVSQKVTVAAMQIAEKKVWAHRS